MLNYNVMRTPNTEEITISQNQIVPVLYKNSVSGKYDTEFGTTYDHEFTDEEKIACLYNFLSKLGISKDCLRQVEVDDPNFVVTVSKSLAYTITYRVAKEVQAIEEEIVRYNEEMEAEEAI